MPYWTGVASTVRLSARFLRRVRGATIYKATGNLTVISSSREFAAFPIDCVTIDDIA